MPQSAVPDLNNAIVAYRSLLQEGLKWRDPAVIVRAVHVLNGCLDEEMKLGFVPWSEYLETHKGTRVVECPYCPLDPKTGLRAAHGLENVRDKLSTMPSAFRTVLGEAESYRVLECPATHGEIYVDDPDTAIVNQPHNAYEAGEAVPEPPPHESIADRALYGAAFEKWATLIASILEDRCRQFRNKYRADSNDTDTGGEGDPV